MKTDLGHSDLAAGFDEILDVAPAPGNGQFGNGGRRHVNAGHRSRPHVIGQVAQHHAVHERRAQVVGQRHFQARFDALSNVNIDIEQNKIPHHFSHYKEIEFYFKKKGRIT